MSEPKSAIFVTITVGVFKVDVGLRIADCGLCFFGFNSTPFGPEFHRVSEPETHPWVSSDPLDGQLDASE